MVENENFCTNYYDHRFFFVLAIKVIRVHAGFHRLLPNLVMYEKFLPKLNFHYISIQRSYTSTMHHATGLTNSGNVCGKNRKFVAVEREEELQRRQQRNS